MTIAGNLLGCLILLGCYLSVTGLCSLCLQEQCYDNGECIIGCIPGYVGKYCKEACSSRCLNKTCHLDRTDGAVTCTDGCQPGYCHGTCSVRCPKGCVSCDRQCGSCNVTLCPERRYGADCGEICSPRYGTCDRETGQCIECRQGYYGHECDQECTTCFTRAETIIDKCLSGCDICKSEETCPTGFRGKSCELICSPGCKTSGCNRATGECSDGCVSGYHGLTCNYNCSEHCVFGKCNGVTGECSTGCVSGYYGLTCNFRCKKFCVGGICNQHNGVCTSGCISGYKSNLDTCENYSNEGCQKAIVVAVSITLVCLLVMLVIDVYIWKRRFRRNRPCC